MIAPMRGAQTSHRMLILIVVVFGILAIAFAMSVAIAADLTDMVLAILAQLRDFGWRGWLIFMAMQAAVALIGFLPASLLGLAAGAIFGLLLGFGLAAAGVMIGALVAFVLARSALRPTIARFLDGKTILRQFDAALTRDGWRLVLLMRVSPVTPFSLTSYALGLSAVRFRDYVVGTLASLPALFLYVMLGVFGATGLAAARDRAGSVRLALVGIGIVATVVLAIRIGRLLTAAFREAASDL